MDTGINRSIGILTARVILGLIFLMQGYGKVFSWGIQNVYASAFKSYEGKLPEVILWITCYYTSFVELIAGALLLFGLFRDYALYVQASVLVIVSFGHGLSSPIWDLSDVLFRLVLLLLLLFVPKEWDTFSLDYRLLSKE